MPISTERLTVLLAAYESLRQKAELFQAQIIMAYAQLPDSPAKFNLGHLLAENHFSPAHDDAAIQVENAWQRRFAARNARQRRWLANRKQPDSFTDAQAKDYLTGLGVSTSRQQRSFHHPFIEPDNLLESGPQPDDPDAGPGLLESGGFEANITDGPPEIQDAEIIHHGPLIQDL